MEGIMRGIVHNIKRALPEPVKEVLKRVVYRLRNRPFNPYLKKKNVEGVVFDFWISDADGRDWYDLHCTDPLWLEMRFIRDHMISQGDVILECGGHHGCTTIVLSKWVGDGGKVITFEPLPKNCNIIEKNIEQNRLQNVTLERKAVGAERGKITINDVSNSSVALSGRGVEVELTRLDEYEYLNPTFLKIDVEGFELQVLQGAKRMLSKRPKFAIEIHTEQLSKYGASVEDLFRLIGVENYKLWIQWEDGKQPEEYDMRTPIVRRVHLFGIPSITKMAAAA
jgi:FkbM family methyltransferase